MKHGNLIAFIFFLGALAWVFVLEPESVESIRSTFLKRFTPVLAASGAVQGDGALQDNRPRAEILEELAAAREELGRLQIKAQQLQRLREDFEQLRGDLDYMKSVEFEPIPARVIKRTRSSWWGVVTINRGADHGVAKDLAVVTEKGLVGKVTANGLTETTAEVLLLTDEQCWVSARIGYRGAVLGFARGERGVTNLRPVVVLTHIEKENKLPAGALIYTSHNSTVYPPDLVIGRIVTPREGESYNSAVIEPAVDFANLSTVFVYKRALSTEEDPPDPMADTGGIP